MAGHTGEEIGVELDISGFNSDGEDVLYYLPAGVPQDAVPIFDEEENAVIGFRWSDPNVPPENAPYAPYRIYDLEGNILEQSQIYDPPIQPVYPLENIILFFVGGTGIRALWGGGRTAVVQGGKILSRGVMMGAGSALISQSAITGLKVAFRIISTRQIFLFTGTAAARMATAGRYVPPNILYMAVRFGRKSPDPQGVAGLFLYSIPISVVRNGRASRKTLKVLMRDRDFTIFHFVYR